MESVDPYDVYGVGDSLSNDERQVRDVVARFVDERALPILPEAFEAGRFPRELIPEIAELGLIGASIDGYGCAGLNGMCYGLICQELERGDTALRSFVSVQTCLVMYPIFTMGSEEQKRRWLRRMSRGEAIGCFGLTESGGGSDPGVMNTFAKRDGDDWIINGAKTWISGGCLADVAVVWAQTDDGKRGFLVERGMPGFSTQPMKHTFSLRAGVTSELFLDDVRVPEANRLPGAKGLSAPLKCLTQARFGVAWGVIGAARACLREVLEFAKGRVLFGSVLSSKQAVQIRLAEMSRRVTIAQLLALQLARLKDAGRLHRAQVSLAKWNNCRMALDVARDARDLLGGAGISVEHCPIRHMLNLESVMTYEGTETIHQLIVGSELTGEQAF